jgi:hypothetical protein
VDCTSSALLNLEKSLRSAYRQVAVAKRPAIRIFLTEQHSTYIPGVDCSAPVELKFLNGDGARVSPVEPLYAFGPSVLPTIIEAVKGPNGTAELRAAARPAAAEVSTQPLVGSLCTGYGGLDQAAVAVLGGQLAWVADTRGG